jgi:hypothetical protein
MAGVPQDFFAYALSPVQGALCPACPSCPPGVPCDSCCPTPEPCPACPGCPGCASCCPDPPPCPSCPSCPRGYYYDEASALCTPFPACPSQPDPSSYCGQGTQWDSYSQTCVMDTSACIHGVCDHIQHGCQQGYQWQEGCMPCPDGTYWSSTDSRCYPIQTSCPSECYLTSQGECVCQ